MQRAFKYRIYPSKAQARKLDATLALCCELYNAGLQERRDAGRINRTTVNYHTQAIQLPEIKSVRPELGTVHSQVLQDVLRRLEKAFNAFFRRLKVGEKPGFPRFRSRARNSITYLQTGFALKAGKLQLSKIGKVKIKLHRPVEGKVKTLTITRSSTGKWFACFCVECEPEPLPATTDATGVDCGLKAFAVLSNGEQVANPKFFRVEEKRLAKAQKKLSAARKGSPERHKRGNFAHPESRKLLNRFGIIVFENLNIRGMLKNSRLAKSIADAAWGQLVEFTTYKAESAGRRVVQVNPRNTSQMCSGCGEIIPKSLSVRIHDCPGCDLVLDRTHNAAINILALGLQGLPQSRIEAAPLQGAE
ncbi:MAG TPA: transposase [Blastocatellia bacterium]|nr:transposase [Blastocatellia bacterium]